ncbi:MAG TPA: glycoside hydrolase family 97 catalytic domain-containing protein [Povalibacter sp.]|nr:glycoside hydrolase family 97 catalytic domain-containing protein [Povalibacter sp.]
MKNVHSSMAVTIGCLATAFSMNAVAAAPTLPATLASPDHRLQLTFSLTDEGEPRYSVQLAGKAVLNSSRLGLVRDDADFSQSLRLVSASPVTSFHDEYELLTIKRRLNRYDANRQSFDLQTRQGQPVQIQFSVSNDGVAFRYAFPDSGTTVHSLESEASSFVFPAATRAWLQPIAVAKSGWSSTNPSYEEIYDRDIPLGSPSPTGAGWIYPALFHTPDAWVLISETGLTRNYSGTRLQSTWRSPEYRIVFPDALEHFQNGAVAPRHTLPWTTPWRVIVVGDLKTLVESTLGTDLAEKPSGKISVQANGPGKASWSWPLLGDDQTNYETQKRFIDYAADMGWSYTLVDALWDKQIGYEKLKELVDYARTKNVRILVWYNSAGDWNETPQTPRNLMLTHASRMSEFAKLKGMGVAGLKVDFFAGDGQSVIQYYQEILEDAGQFGFLMNFHGATLPRGWERTYPNLMTMEAIRGLEFVTFEQKNAEDEPTHATMLPFTRNVFDPMDFTPVVLDRIRNIERRTSSAFELALAVLFTSGIQHYAEIPEGMAKAPSYVKEFMRAVPSIWDDVRFIDGYPGKYVVLARRSGSKWYVAGINGETPTRDVTIDLRPLNAKTASVITDGDGSNLSFRQSQAQGQIHLTLRGRGGFVAVAQ